MACKTYIDICNEFQVGNNHKGESYLRKKKLMALRQTKIAFPNDFRRNFISNQLHEKFDSVDCKELKRLNITVSIAGRMISKRVMGKVSFITLRDMGGVIQVYLSQDKLSTNFYQDEFKKWDIGDILGVCGTLFKTRTKELSIFCKKIRLLTKSIRSFPDKFHGLVDPDIRYRQRYLDLIANKESVETFKTRSIIIMEIRNFMIEHGFMEVETPMMHSIPGGAMARPFITHHNSFNSNMYLRISPELYLKKLVIGGFEKVFEINRSFRNEGFSSIHNPEFTILELYMAYVDYQDLIIFIEGLIRYISKKILNSYIIKYGDMTINVSHPFIRMNMKEAIYYYYPQVVSQNIEDMCTLIDIARSLEIEINSKWGIGRLQTKIFEKVIENKLVQPTFVTGYPSEVSPLARRNDINPFISDRFELFIGGYEIGNGFSELNDPDDQSLRFFKQSCINENNEFLEYDQDYIIALEYGLPPTAGVGIGIDRLVMLLTNSHNIRDVILFPTLKPKN